MQNSKVLYSKKEHIKNILVKKVKNYQMQFWKDGFLGVFWISQGPGRFLFLVVVYSKAMVLHRRISFLHM